MKLQSAVLLAAVLTLASLSQNEASASDRRGRVVQSDSATATTSNPLMSTPTTILPRGDDLRNVPAPGGGRLIGYGLNLHPGGRAARMLLSR